MPAPKSQPARRYQKDKTGFGAYTGFAFGCVRGGRLCAYTEAGQHAC